MDTEIDVKVPNLPLNNYLHIHAHVDHRTNVLGRVAVLN